MRRHALIKCYKDIDYEKNCPILNQDEVEVTTEESVYSGYC